jgi:hypothetical protein
MAWPPSNHADRAARDAPRGQDTDLIELASTSPAPRQLSWLNTRMKAAPLVLIVAR